MAIPQGFAKHHGRGGVGREVGRSLAPSSKEGVRPRGGEEKLMEIQQHDGVVVEAVGFQQGFAKRYLRRKRCHGRERGRAAPRERENRVCGSPKTPTIYRGKGCAPI